ncbi:MAG TPA: response regulator [Reyranellaceae bacterium]|nr:response regulator [Reyranellaceae bacterium]
MSVSTMRHILVVDDEPAFRRLVVRMLERGGYRVSHVEEYVGALKLVETDRTIDLLLVDVGMPAGTPQGISIAKMSQMRQALLKIVYMTGGDAQQVTEYADGAPVLQKPFTADQLLKTVASALAGESGR